MEKSPRAFRRRESRAGRRKQGANGTGQLAERGRQSRQSEDMRRARPARSPSGGKPARRKGGTERRRRTRRKMGLAEEEEARRRGKRPAMGTMPPRLRRGGGREGCRSLLCVCLREIKKLGLLPLGSAVTWAKIDVGNSTYIRQVVISEFPLSSIFSTFGLFNQWVTSQEKHKTINKQ